MLVASLSRKSIFVTSPGSVALATPLPSLFAWGQMSTFKTDQSPFFHLGARCWLASVRPLRGSGPLPMNRTCWGSAP